MLAFWVGVIFDRNVRARSWIKISFNGSARQMAFFLRTFVARVTLKITAKYKKC
jgi:hypothetical protein